MPRIACLSPFSGGTNHSTGTSWFFFFVLIFYSAFIFFIILFRIFPRSFLLLSFHCLISCIIFSPLSLFWKKIEVRFWDHLAVYVSPPYQLLNASTNLYEIWYIVYQGTWVHLNGVLHKFLPSVCVPVCITPVSLLCNGSVNMFSRQRIHATMKNCRTRRFLCGSCPIRWKWTINSSLNLLSFHTFHFLFLSHFCDIILIADILFGNFESPFQLLKLSSVELHSLW
jgi:hypothetical protein